MKGNKQNNPNNNKIENCPIKNKKRSTRKNSRSSVEEKTPLLKSVKTFFIKIFTAIKDRASDIISNIGDVLGFLIGKTGIGFEPGTKKERSIILKRIALTIVITAVLIVMIILGAPWVKYYNEKIVASSNLNDKDWLGFIGSFWGALIASIITLAGSIFTTWLIIQRSYKVDYHRERLENMPVLQMTLNITLTKEINKAKNEEEMEEIAEKYIYRDSYKYDPPNETVLIVEIENIGKGIAFKVETPNSNEVDNDITFPAICPNQKVEFLTSVGDVAEESFVFKYFDMFENYYEQHIGLVFKGDQNEEAYPIVNPPELITKTKKIRYVQ